MTPFPRFSLISCFFPPPWEEDISWKVSVMFIVTAAAEHSWIAALSLFDHSGLNQTPPIENGSSARDGFRMEQDIFCCV